MYSQRRIVFLFAITSLVSSSPSRAKKRAENVFDQRHELASNEALQDKRSCLNLVGMLECVLNKDMVTIAVEMTGYGCYCGPSFGVMAVAEGTKAVDAIDECCKEHDDCWGQVSNDLSSWCLGYFTPYAYTSSCDCQPASFYWFQKDCKKALCECDRTFAQCLKDQWGQYSAGKTCAK